MGRGQVAMSPRNIFISNNLATWPDLATRAQVAISPVRCPDREGCLGQARGAWEKEETRAHTANRAASAYPLDGAEGRCYRPAFRLGLRCPMPREND